MGAGRASLHRSVGDERLPHLSGYAACDQLLHHSPPYAAAEDLCWALTEDTDLVCHCVLMPLSGSLHKLLFLIQFSSQGSVPWLHILHNLPCDERSANFSNL